MPPPLPPPVEFDQQLAQEAMDALQSAAMLLQQRTATDLANARSARDGWSGHHYDRFVGVDLPWIEYEARRIMDGLLKLRATIATAAANAAALQAAQNHGN
jgi:hypothetical protein